MLVSAGTLDGLVGLTFAGAQFVGVSVASFAQAADGTVLDVLTEVINSESQTAGIAVNYAIVAAADSADQITVNAYTADTSTFVQSMTYNVVGYNAQSILVSSMSLPALIAALLAGQSIAGQIGALNADYPATGASLTFHPSGSFVGAIPCFALGTHIRTLGGEVPVQDVRTGDHVPGLVSGRLRRVRWVGGRTVRIAAHPRPWDVAPVRVRAGALAPGRPHRDVRLSPDHAVLVEGVLIPVRYLLNGATVVQEFVDTIAYLHIELDAHDVLLADGLPCESFLDTGNRAAFAEAAGPARRSAQRLVRPGGIGKKAPCPEPIRGGRALGAVSFG
jgi:hypothetical protein